jgi:hypothetical protein
LSYECKGEVVNTQKRDNNCQKDYKTFIFHNC